MSGAVSRAMRATWSRVSAGFAEPSMPMTPAVATARRGEAGDHAGLGAAGHGADHDGVEEDTELLLLGRQLRGTQFGETQSAEAVVGGARGDRVRLAACRLDLGQRRLLPALP